MKNAFVLLFCLFALNAYSQNPLYQFEPLIGGEWYLENSYQTFEWGVGKQSVIAKNFIGIGGKMTLVAEGIWYWHPGEKKIKGVFTAIEMPVVLFDYVTEFKDGNLHSQMIAYDASGNSTRYNETWVFIDENSFEWNLFDLSNADGELVMNAIYTRE